MYQKVLDVGKLIQSDEIQNFIIILGILVVLHHGRCYKLLESNKPLHLLTRVFAIVFLNVTPEQMVRPKSVPLKDCRQAP